LYKKIKCFTIGKGFTKGKKNMIQDIAPMKLDNVYKKKTPHAGSRMLGFGDRTVFLEYNGEDH
jgi:hypothetical protein